MVTLPTCESEIIAHVTGFKLMIGIRDLIKEVTMTKVKVVFTP